MGYSTPDDLNYRLTQMLRKVPGVTAVYATAPVLPKVLSTVVEVIKNEPTAVHLVTIRDADGGIDIDAYVGVSADEAAPDVCRRAHDAIREYVAGNHDLPARAVKVKIGRVG
ncbi:hypothetical protein [Naasia lichenicola]|uniref:Uncharacterized protein n=1 Tax=Naasia lichenicola TaxID=2565933 RepID=A0A4V6RZ04_9MICO|nr:hypothetical protein [Naasia lichenicola]THG30047.1 hypothetical protein E6C64_15530 [Naasia lichenicola]